MGRQIAHRHIFYLPLLVISLSSCDQEKLNVGKGQGYGDPYILVDSLNLQHGREDARIAIKSGNCQFLIFNGTKKSVLIDSNMSLDQIRSRFGLINIHITDKYKSQKRNPDGFFAIRNYIEQYNSEILMGCKR